VNLPKTRVVIVGAGQAGGRAAEALRAAGKTFEYHLYTNAPGGHMFNRLDTNFARQSRKEIWNFLRPYLKPPRTAQ